MGAASDGDKGKPLTKGHLARTVLRGIATNQILIVIFLGLLYNTLIGPWLPNFATSCLKTAGEAFPAVALFHVGLKMVGNTSQLSGRGLFWPLSLSGIKVSPRPWCQALVYRCMPHLGINVGTLWPGVMCCYR